MAQVMDATQGSGQMMLLTELHSRFPEVPLDIIQMIMAQCYCNRERCIEMLAKECQKYHQSIVDSSRMGHYSAEDLAQRRESNESLSSVSSGLGGTTPPVNPGNPALPMRSSMSYPYIPPSESPAAGNASHNPAPRSSLPVISLDLLFPVTGQTDGNSPPTTAGTSRPSRYHSQQDPVSTYGATGNSEAAFRRDLSPVQPSNRLKTVMSEVSYRINSPSNPAGEQSASPANPTYLSAARVNVPAAEGRDMLLETSRRPQSNSLTAGFACTALSSNPAPPGVHSAAVYVNPLQAFVANTPLNVSSFPSRECLASVAGGKDDLAFLAPSYSSANPASTSSSCNNGSVLASDTECVDDSYANALRMCQSVNFEKLSCKHQELMLYSNESQSCIGRLETQLTHRLMQRSQAFPTAEDVEKLKQENKKLRVNIQLLTREIDLANDGETPLGVLDPEEQQSFNRRDSYRRTRSEASSSSSISSPVTPQVLPVSPSIPPVPPISEVPPTNQHADESEGDHWSCSACTFLNHPALKLCECCEMPRVPPSLQ